MNALQCLTYVLTLNFINELHRSELELLYAITAVKPENSCNLKNPDVVSVCVMQTSVTSSSEVVTFQRLTGCEWLVSPPSCPTPNLGRTI